MSRFTNVDLDNWSDEEILKYLNLFAEENEQLTTELAIKEELIQQLRNAVYTDDREEMLKFRRLYVSVCEDLAEMHTDYRKVSDENEQFKKRIGQLEAKLSIQSDIKLNGWKND